MRASERVAITWRGVGSAIVRTVIHEIKNVDNSGGCCL